MPSTAGETPLATLLIAVGDTGRFVLGVVLVVIICGLYAASLSTASTQLIAASQTIHTDILRAKHKREDIAQSSYELRFARLLLVGIAAMSVLVVEVLRAAGFSIADLVFAVYGAQLGLVPVVFLALFNSQDRNQRLKDYAASAAIIGFASGWGTAGYGKFAGIDSLVFLAPVASLLSSTIICGAGILLAQRR